MNNYSKEHYEFLKLRRREKRVITISRLIIIFSLLILWEIFARIGIINTFLFSSPKEILKTIITLVRQGDLFKHVSITLIEIIISFALSGIGGILIATFLWSNQLVHRVIEPFITVANSLPKVALGPLIIIWLGASVSSIIFMSLLISLFVTIINIYQAFITTNQNHIIMSRSFGATKWQIFKYVVFPSNWCNIISALKINISMNLIGVIMGELLVSKKGLGYLIMYGSQIFNINLVITCVFVLGFISYFMYLIINKIK